MIRAISPGYPGDLSSSVLRQPAGWMFVGRRAVRVAAMLMIFATAAVPAWAQSDDEEDALLVSEARQAMAEKKYREAAVLLDRALQVNPRRVEAYVLRATVHGVFKEYDKGIAMMRRARRLAPDNPYVLTTLGSQLMLAERESDGVPILEQVVSSWPDRFEAHLRLGSHYVQKKQWPEAITAYESYLKTRPSQLKAEDSTHRLDLANAYLRSGSPGKARKLYERIRREQPNSVLGRMGQAWSAAAMDCREALPLLRDMDDLAAKYLEVLMVRTRCALLVGEAKQALADAQQILAAAESNRAKIGNVAAAWALLAEARLANRDFQGSMTAMLEASKRAPKNRMYTLKLARIERLAGKPELAADRLLGSKPPPEVESEWTIELGEALNASGKFAVVRQRFVPFVKKNPNFATARTLLGIAVYELGEADTAIGHLEKAIELDAGQKRARKPLIEALNVVAIAAFQAGDGKKAEGYLVRADAVGGSADTWRNLGAIRLVAGRAKAAIAPLKKAVEAADDQPLPHHLLGRAYYATGKHKDAIRLYVRAGKLTPRSDKRHATKIDLDHAAALLAAGENDKALGLLEDALKTAVGSAQRARVAENYVVAGRKMATADMKVANFPRAYKLLSRVADKLPNGVAKKTRNKLDCDLALAATGSGTRRPALKLLKRLEDERVRCDFVAPADELAVQILIAWNEGATARTARKALRRLGAMRRKARGPAALLVRTAARDIAVRAAVDAYQNNRLKRARAFLDTARRYGSQSVEIDHNMAVLDLASGRVDRAIRLMQGKGTSVPEALLNLGIAYDYKSEPLKALKYYRRSVAAGVRSSAVKSWIRGKERLWGSAKGGNK
ncbi:MAG: tetratricopeptide repeat protein [Proteobacteria bacterium]|nr:tetratricopeptide repeat protein [Pseudomonadota bacterium]